MLILCDLEIRDFEYFHNLHIGELSLILEIKEFVFLKIQALKDEIELEELMNETAFTLVYILPGIKSGTVDFNYSKALAAQLEACFLPDDWRQLGKMVRGQNM
jgi:hypothetical protein